MLENLTTGHLNCLMRFIKDFLLLLVLPIDINLRQHQFITAKKIIFNYKTQQTFGDSLGLIFQLSVS
jgi:hypothetical protein